MRWTGAALIFALTAWCSCVYAGVDIDRLVSDIESIRSGENIPAVGVVIVDAGPTRSPATAPFVKAWGSSGNPASPAVDATTPMRLGSITKTFTALALAKLLHERDIDPSTPLDTIVGPGSHDNPFHGRPVRLRHLVEHTAGLGDLSRAEFDYTNPNPISLVDAFALDPASRHVWWPPGTRHSYSNVGAGLTSLAIERLSGETFEAFTTRTVLLPLGMRAAGFFPVDNLAGGYRADGFTGIPYWQMTFRAYGALNASTAEMAGFIGVLLDGGWSLGVRVLPEAVFAQLRHPVSTLAAEAGLGIGYALGMYGWVNHGQVFWGHGGDADGYRSRYGWVAAAGRAYFVIINADNPRAFERIRSLIERELARDLPPPVHPPPVAPVPAAGLTRWAGEYYPSSARFRIADWRARRLPTVRVVAAEGGLEFRTASRTTRLLPVNDSSFRRETDPVATMVFVPQGSCVHLQGELGNFVRIEPSAGEAFQNRCIWE